MSTIESKSNHPASTRPDAAWRTAAETAAIIAREATGNRRPAPLATAVRHLFTSLATLGIITHASDPALARVRHRLSDREIDVLIALSNGRSNADIGRELFVSEHTVKTHTCRLYRKLGARDRAHAVANAFRLGILR